ncbi:MAG: pilus assembly protein PilM [Candidatus Buchananbacteria bacterium]
MFGKKTIGLNISDYSIEALVLAKPLFGNFIIQAYARTLLPKGVVDNGEIKNEDKLVGAMTELLASARPEPIKNGHCILSLPESQTFSTIIKLPSGLKAEEIINTVPFEVEEAVPFKTDEIYFDFKTIGCQGPTQEIFYTAVKKSIVDSYVAVLKKVNLSPLAFELESNSLARALLNHPSSDQAKILVDIGSRTTKVYIFDRQGTRESLILDIAGNKITKAIAAGLKVSILEAEKIKLTSGFNPQTEAAKRVTKILETEFKKIVIPTKKFLTDYQTQNQRTVDEVILTGGSALFENLDQLVADELGIKTDIGNPLDKIQDFKNIFKHQNSAAIFSNALGLALRGVGHDPVNSDINLLPLAPQTGTSDFYRIAKWLGIILIMAVLVFGLLVSAKKFNFFGGAKNLEETVSEEKSDSGYEGDSLINIDQNIGQDIATTTPNTNAATTTTPITPSTSTPARASDQATSTALTQVNQVKIKPTSLGYLNVRQGPGTSYAKVGRAQIGKVYTIISQKADWYQIQIDAKLSGWVSAAYVEKL